MPVLIVGADTPLGEAVVGALEPREAEIRAFVTDPSVGDALRSRGLKVAIGDVSDGSHVEGAAIGCFSAVLVPEALFDDRERAFADSPAATVTSWASGLRDAAIRRIIWIEDSRIPDVETALDRAAEEVGVVPSEGRNPAEIAVEVARLDNLETLA